MPRLISVTLTTEQRLELHRRARARDLAPRMRDRLEMVRLSDLGLSIPRIAAEVDTNEPSVRRYLKAFLAGGFDALPDRPRPGRPPSIMPCHLTAVEELLDRSGRGRQTWTLAKLVSWLEREHSVTISTARLSVLLNERRGSGRRSRFIATHRHYNVPAVASAIPHKGSWPPAVEQRRPA